MKLQTLQPHPSISTYVHNIVVLEADDLNESTIIPLIAKGFPSIVFQTTGSGRSGKRFFREGLHTKGLTLVRTIPLDKGVIALHYRA
jgi:hypothetical protein